MLKQHKYIFKHSMLESTPYREAEEDADPERQYLCYYTTLLHRRMGRTGGSTPLLNNRRDLEASQRGTAWLE